MNQTGRWRFGVIAGAVALMAGMASLPAQALSLGRLSVLSALGEPLRAEIDVAQITPEEATSLKTAVGTPEAFKAAGLEYTPLLAGLDVTLQRRADGRSYLRLTSSRPVSEPFVDLVLQATWSAGQLTRDYTMLFDPPGSRANATAAAPAAPARAAAPRLQETVPRASPPAVAVRPESAARAPRTASAPAASTGGDKKLTVKAGDTAGQIAAQNKPGAVSLDQMLVAMLRSNPNAFIDGNINRLKAGSVLDLPGADTAGAVSAGEASQTVVAQSRDFNAFRRKLAAGVSTAPVDSPDRQAGGKVQAKIEDRAAAAANPDKLTLSKGAVKGSPAAVKEEAIAKNRQAIDDATRMAELSKNISDLNKLGAAPGAAASGATAAAAASAVRTPGVPVAAPSGLATPAVPSASAAAAPASSPVPSSSPVSAPAPVVATGAAAAASAAVAATAAASGAESAAVAAIAAASATAPISGASAPGASASAPSSPSTTASAASAPGVLPPETNLLDDLLANPLILPLGAGLLALLAGLGIYSYRKKKSSAPVDSSFLESRLQPDSFFGASGGQRIDTSEANASGSSLVYSPSQLDAAGDVDPVAEADVYLAYGRDLQAEEILKEALRTNGTRVAIHAKLAEIYAKRRDAKAFEAIALEAFNLTQGSGPEWVYITEIGRELDAVNPLYQSGGQPSGSTPISAPAASLNPAVATATAAGLGATVIMPAVTSRATTTDAPKPAAANLDFDLELDDYPLGGLQDGYTQPAPLGALDASEPIRTPVFDSLDMDFSDISSKPIALTYPVPIASAPEDVKREPTIKPVGAVQSLASVPAVPAVPLDSGMLEFDLDSLSLDLGGPNTQNSGSVPDRTGEGDHLQTKFDLAEEFRSLGDAEGARSLAEEVLLEAKGPLKIKAQAFLNALA